MHLSYLTYLKKGYYTTMTCDTESEERGLLSDFVENIRI